MLSFSFVGHLLDLGGGIGKTDLHGACVLYNFSSAMRVNTGKAYLFLAEMDWEISAAYVRLFMRRRSRSFSLVIVIFLKPPGMQYLVSLLDLLPILGIWMLPLNFRLTLESIP